MSLKIFADSDALLAEGPSWHPQRQSLFWLDILNRRLYEKSYPASCETIDRHWDLPEMASALAMDSIESGTVWMVTNKSFGRFSLNSGRYEPRIQLNLAPGMRANDGAVGPKGDFWFGSMEQEPTGLNGAVFSISRTGVLTQQLQHVGIPNTFCWSNGTDKFYLSDSFRQCMFSYRYFERGIDQSSGRRILDLSSTKATPDGGAMDQQGNLWNCQWDASRVVCYSPSGDVLQVLELPVPRPTSCCFGGPDNRHLFITTAREGLNQQQLIDFVDSGSVFVVELPVTGQLIPLFQMDEQVC